MYNIGDIVKVNLHKYYIEYDMIEFERYEASVTTKILDKNEEGKYLVEYQLFDDEDFWIDEEAIYEVCSRRHK